MRELADTSFLDFQRAFENDSHKSLLEKLSNHKMRSKTLSLIRNQLQKAERKSRIHLLMVTAPCG